MYIYINTTVVEVPSGSDWFGGNGYGGGGEGGGSRIWV